jgi:hypothetical protein
VEAERKSPATPSPDVDAPAPHPNDGVASLGDLTDRSLTDALQGEMAGKGSTTYEQCA